MSKDELIRPIDWLLEADNPPVRYLTLTRLLNRPESDPEVLAAKSRLMEYDVTRGILEHANAVWTDDEPYAKYKGRYWQLIFLGYFGADGQDPRIQPGVERTLDEDGWVWKRAGQCLTANLLAAMTRLGFGEHPRVRKEREQLARQVLENRGIDCEVMDYSLLPLCQMAQSKLLRCFTQVEPGRRSEAISEAVNLLVENLLENEIFVYVPKRQSEWKRVLAAAPRRGELPPGRTIKQWIGATRDEFLREKGFGGRKPKPGWRRFGFPLHYNSDVLETAYALARAEVSMEPRLQRPLQLIEKKQSTRGRWVLENSLNGKMWVDVEEKGKPSKWLTYFALFVLQHFRADRGQ